MRSFLEPAYIRDCILYKIFWRYGDFLLPFKGSLIYLFILGTRKRNKNDGFLEFILNIVTYLFGSYITRNNDCILFITCFN